MTQVGLDSQDEIRQLDSENVLGSVEKLAEQFLHGWEEANKVEVPEDYRRVKALVMTGMGGSGLGARLIESVFGGELRVPLVRVNGYGLPGFVDRDTLVVCSSYSGMTEETVENARQAIGRGAKWMGLGTGGELEELAREAGAPFYKIVPKYNPSGQPRMAMGYSVAGQLALGSKAGILQLSHEEIREAVGAMRGVKKRVEVGVVGVENSAKQLARKMQGKIVVLVAAEHLTGAVHVVKNQLNENAKVFGVRFDIPELNHHLMEGLANPVTNKRDLFSVLCQSSLYGGKNQKRVRVTEEVIGKQGIGVGVWRVEGETRLAQALGLVQLGAYASFYLAMLYGVDPAAIPWVEYFKERMGEGE